MQHLWKDIMRIIEQEEETTLPQEETPKVTETKKDNPAKSSVQQEILQIAKDFHELGNKLIELATKL